MPETEVFRAALSVNAAIQQFNRNYQRRDGDRRLQLSVTQEYLQRLQSSADAPFYLETNAEGVRRFCGVLLLVRPEQEHKMIIVER